MTISGAITPPAWWVARLQGRVKMGAGRAPLRSAGERILRHDPARFARVLLPVEQIADTYEGRIEITPTAHWPASLDASADAC